MPNGTDLSRHTAGDLARFAHSLNNRSRRTLGYMKPSERPAELIATTRPGPNLGPNLVQGFDKFRPTHYEWQARSPPAWPCRLAVFADVCPRP
jgi:hypothetical protein